MSGAYCLTRLYHTSANKAVSADWRQEQHPLVYPVQLLLPNINSTCPLFQTVYITKYNQYEIKAFWAIVKYMALKTI